MGTHAAQVSTEGDPGYIGASKHTSSAAELSGVTWALQCVLQYASQIREAEIWFASKR